MSNEGLTYAYRIIHADAEGRICNIIESDEIITAKGHVRNFAMDMLKEVLKNEGTLTFIKKERV